MIRPAMAVVANDAALSKFLSAAKAPPSTQEAYRYALHHPEVLSKIPCYCGCARFGHKSNENCFRVSNPKLAQKQPFDYHGIVCPMCVSIALQAKKLQSQHVPLPEIRRRIDAAYKPYPELIPTPTPKPFETKAKR